MNLEYLSFDENDKWYFHNESDESSSEVQLFIFRWEKKESMSNEIRKYTLSTIHNTAIF